MAADNNEDLESFLGKVDEVESIIKEMTVGDPSTQISAIEKADAFLQHHTAKQSQCDKTVININKDNNLDSSSVTSAWMLDLEEDANRRAEENKQRKAKADKLKEQGNSFFNEQHYEKAIMLYTDALEVYKRSTAVYTNRAQAYIKIKKYEEAIADCELALKLDEYCVKAYVHKGRALQSMKDYHQAIDTFKEAIKKIPKQEKVLKGLIAIVEIEKSTENTEPSNLFLII